MAHRAGSHRHDGILGGRPSRVQRVDAFRQRQRERVRSDRSREQPARLRDSRLSGISFIEPWTHQGSKTNLLGDAPDPALARSLSSETQVTASTPQTFIYQTNADTTTPAENAVSYYLALRKAGVPAEMHIFRDGRHGSGLGMTDPALAEWPRLLANWLRVSHLL